MNELTGVYAGTFDPPTVGHYSIITRAATIFQKLYVVVAQAPGKTPMFSVGQRSSMLKHMVDQTPLGNCNIEVLALPANVYLATFAKSKNAKLLVRGIHDAFDFQYEEKLYHTNRKIQDDIETIYLMPDAKYNLVSSSWVKGLMGNGGWRDVISPFVFESTLKELKMYYARERFMKLCKNPVLKLQNNMNWNSYDAWDRIVFHMVNRPYHNIDHILDCLEAMDLYWREDPVMEFAFWIHDLFDNEDDCATLAYNALKTLSPLAAEQARMYIYASKHQTCHYSTVEERVFASIDLLILASPKYEQYTANVYEEYKAKADPKIDFPSAWRTGRIAFINKMLAREFIFPSKQFRDLPFESNAISNLKAELEMLEKPL